MTVAVIDYGMGNVRSVAKALDYAADCPVTITQDPATILAADRVVLPGVGALQACMDGLREHGLLDCLQTVISDRPFLGICLGMQALLESSEEGGDTRALNILPGQVKHFGRQTTEQGLKVPHMGWNRVRQRQAHPLWSGIADDSWFYFVHSYFVDPADDRLIAGETDYGAPFCSAVARGNIFAVQFHPEKSQQAGIRLLANFLAWDGHA